MEGGVEGGRKERGGEGGGGMEGEGKGHKERERGFAEVGGGGSLQGGERVEKKIIRRGRRGRRGERGV